MIDQVERRRTAYRYFVVMLGAASLRGDTPSGVRRSRMVGLCQRVNGIGALAKHRGERARLVPADGGGRVVQWCDLRIGFAKGGEVYVDAGGDRIKDVAAMAKALSGRII